MALGPWCRKRCPYGTMLFEQVPRKRDPAPVSRAEVTEEGLAEDDATVAAAVKAEADAAFSGPGVGNGDSAEPIPAPGPSEKKACCFGTAKRRTRKAKSGESGITSETNREGKPTFDVTVDGAVGLANGHATPSAQGSVGPNEASAAKGLRWVRRCTVGYFADLGG